MRLAIFLLFCVGLAAAVPLHSSDSGDLDELMFQSEGWQGRQIINMLKRRGERARKDPRLDQTIPPRQGGEGSARAVTSNPEGIFRTWIST
ncbi:hypothetical protein AVEN_178958-1 [Araneus ventricosus]|uniref:Uncharacterized protein n=1 Tax=Araneus ventricosus TaxID=182803 RepID=A0A4Y2UXE4_ARAVE|nr:hypothetical protein AVEN_178958-1 [Araneus ventricosus]